MSSLETCALFNHTDFDYCVSAPAGEPLHVLSPEEEEGWVLVTTMSTGWCPKAYIQLEGLYRASWAVADFLVSFTRVKGDAHRNQIVGNDSSMFKHLAMLPDFLHPLNEVLGEMVRIQKNNQLGWKAFKEEANEGAMICLRGASSITGTTGIQFCIGHS